MRIPKYRRRPDRNTGFVEYQGCRYHFPGPYDSPESLRAYHEFAQRLLADQQPDLPARPIVGEITVTELVAAFLEEARKRYLKEGRPGSEFTIYCQVVKPLIRLHGDTEVHHFGPLALKEVRDAMVSGSWKQEDDKGKTRWVRSSVNKHVHRIRNIFRWGVENELVTPDILASLREVSPLRHGSTDADESTDVEPVELSQVEAVLPHVSPVVADMIRLQRLTGMRSESLVTIRPCDVDQSGPVWIYRPLHHKGSWRGHDLHIPLGPQAQAVLEPYLTRPADACCFQPAESETWRSQKRRAIRKTPLRSTSTVHHRRGSKPRPLFRARYSTGSYRRAVERGCEAAFQMPPELRAPPKRLPAHERAVLLAQARVWRQEHCWTPHQLRHTVGKRVRQKYGLEGAQVYLGHRHAKTTEIYADRDLALALRIAGEIG